MLLSPTVATVVASRGGTATTTTRHCLLTVQYSTVAIQYTVVCHFAINIYFTNSLSSLYRCTNKVKEENALR